MRGIQQKPITEFWKKYRSPGITVQDMDNWTWARVGRRHGVGKGRDKGMGDIDIYM